VRGVRLAAALAVLASATLSWPDAPKADAPSPKAPEPWPDADELRRRREDAEGRALFQTTEPLEFTLRADFKALGKDRKPGSTQRFPAVVEVRGDDGQLRSIAVRLSTRGHARLVQNCGFVPLRVEFPRDGVAGTAFAGHGTLKLVTHCHGSRDFEQGALREHLAYRLYNLITPRSFRVRLARATYVDSQKNETVATRYATFLETERDLARRMEGRIAALPKTTFRHVDPPHAVPPRMLGVKTVLERVYLGPCLTAEELPPLLATFNGKKAEALGLVDSLEGLQDGTRREVKAYLGEFFAITERPKDAKRILIDNCRKRPGM
jgi:hypothetical protein